MFVRPAAGRIAMLFAFWLAVGWGTPLREARAAQPATVDVEGVELREGPGPGFKSLGALPRGAPVAASNQAIEGFFKVRTSDGKVGFVPADTLVLQPLAPGGAPDEPAQVASAPEPASEPAARPSDARLKRPFRFKAFGGYNFFSVADLNTLFSAEVLEHGYSFGVELDYCFLARLCGVLRAERVFKSVTATDQAARTFDIGASSYPVMAGLDARVLGGKRWSVHLAALGGLAPLTGITSTRTTDPSGDITKFSATGIAGLGKLELVYHPDAGWGVFAEGGYRYLTTSQQTPVESGASATIFQSGGADVPIAFDLSGLYAGAGFAFRF